MILLHNFTTAIKKISSWTRRVILFVLFFLFYINDNCIVNLLPIIYHFYLLCCAMFLFGLSCVVVLALSFCHTLYTYICILHCDEKPNAWTVAGSSSLDQKTLHYIFFLIYFSFLPVKYLIYLTGFHCPVDSVLPRTTLM